MIRALAVAWTLATALGLGLAFPLLHAVLERALGTRMQPGLLGPALLPGAVLILVALWARGAARFGPMRPGLLRLIRGLALAFGGYALALVWTWAWAALAGAAPDAYARSVGITGVSLSLATGFVGWVAGAPAAGTLGDPTEAPSSGDRRQGEDSPGD